MVTARTLPAIERRILKLDLLFPDGDPAGRVGPASRRPW
jgi:hypothetical protein